MNKVKTTSHFMDKIIANPNLIKDAKQIIGSNCKFIDDQNIKDSEMMDLMKLLCLDTPPQEWLDENKISKEYLETHHELGVLLWEDIDANVKHLRSAFEKDLSRAPNPNFIKYPNTYTLGVYLKSIMESLKQLEKAHKNLFN